MTRSAITPATDGQKDGIARLIEEAGKDLLRDLGLGKDDAQRLLGKGGYFKSELARVLGPIIARFSMAPIIVVVPDMGAVELTALTERELRLTCLLDPDYRTWNYYQSHDGQPIVGRGLKFEVLVVPKTDIKLSGNVSFSYARDYLRERGYIGHVGAFIEWRRQNPTIMGYHVSIPEDSECWRNPNGGILYVPYSYFAGDRRELGLAWLGRDLSVVEPVVGFREVSA